MPNTKSHFFAHTGDSEALKTKAENFNNYFANVGKNTFLKSQQHVTENNSLLQLNSDDIDLRLNMLRPQPTDSNTNILIIKKFKKCKLAWCSRNTVEMFKRIPSRYHSFSYLHSKHFNWNRNLL